MVNFSSSQSQACLFALAVQQLIYLHAKNAHVTPARLPFHVSHFHSPAGVCALHTPVDNVLAFSYALRHGRLAKVKKIAFVRTHAFDDRIQLEGYSGI